MPAILRIFVYQTDASLSVLGHSGSYDQGGHGPDSVGLQHSTVNALSVQADPGSRDDDDPDDHQMLYSSRYLQSRLVSDGNDLQ